MRTDTVDLVLDHAELAQPVRLGWAHAQPSGTFGVRVRITLDQMPATVAAAIGTLDPDLRWHPGDQYPAGNRPTFGLLQDIAPDRWGRRLMDRRHARDRRLGVITGPARLSHWDYLLGVDDRFRLGALRLRGPEGRWIDDGARGAVPPIAQLRTLEHQARVVEEDPEGTIDEDINLLMAPGSSLGGARPKATVVDNHGRVWIAKFPSIADEDDNVSEDECRIDLDLARSVAGFYRVDHREVNRIIAEMQGVVRRWRAAAALLSATAASCERMALAFRLAEDR